MPYFIMASRSTPMPNAKPESFSGIVIHEAVDGGIDHARAEQLDPAGKFADAAAAAAADVAGGVHFHGRLGEREIAGAQARFRLAGPRNSRTKYSTVPLKSQKVMSVSTASPSIWWNM